MLKAEHPRIDEVRDAPNKPGQREPVHGHRKSPQVS